MSDFQEQLAALRRKMARIDRKYAGPPKAPPPDPRKPERYFPEDWLHGQEVETEFGKHYEFEKFYPRHGRYGSIGISDLECLPGDLLDPISNGEIKNVEPEKWCFLDTETTGLAGGSGTYAFLIGVGRITPEGFRVRQFFMREFGEEASLLNGLTRHLEQFEVLITYNGRVYNQPLLETRYRMARLSWLDRGTGRVIRRYEHAHPGDLVHLDVKRLGKIPDGGGWRIERLAP